MLKAILTAAALAAMSMPAFAQTVLRVGLGQAANDPQTIIFQEVADKVKQRTNGEVVLRIFPSGQLGSERDMQEQVKLGAPIITTVDSGYFTNYSTKDVGVLSATFAISSYEGVQKVLASDLAKTWLSKAESNNIKILSFNWYFGERHIIGKKPFPTPADLKGVKFRLAPIGVYIDSFKALGVSPVTLDFSEVYGALQQGVVDAAEGALSSLSSSKLYEVAPFVTRTAHVKQIIGVMINKSIFDSIPEASRAILIEEMTAGGEKFSEQNIRRQSELRANMVKAGVTFIDPDMSAYNKTVMPIYEQYRDWSAGLSAKVQAISDVK